MGQQTGFFAVEEDLRLLLDHAQRAGMLALPSIVPTETYDTDGISGVPPLEYRGASESGAFYLVPESMPIVEAFYHELPGDPSGSMLASQVSPVIQVVPSQIRDGELSNGRIYFGLAQADRRYPVAHKAYERLTRFLREWDKTDQFRFHVGPRTAELAREGRIRLKHHNSELKV
jgi:hypothetical protein